jgi:hypothetical protein
VHVLADEEDGTFGHDVGEYIVEDVFVEDLDDVVGPP